MALTLLDTKHLGKTSFGLCFQIDNLGEDTLIDGQTVDVHGLVKMKFYVQNTTDSQSKISLLVYKHELTLEMEVEVRISCHKPKFKVNFAKNKSNRSKTMNEPTTLFTSPYTKKLTFNMEVHIMVESCRSVLDIMYGDKDFTDFQLSIAEGSVSVHRAVLAAYSDVFQRMFCGEWKETAAGCIVMEGVTLKTLEDLKRYLYLKSLPEDGLYPLLRIAAYYLIDDLKVECIIKLAHSINSENLFDHLEFSYASNIPELTFAVLRAVRAQPRDVIEVAYQQMTKPKRKNGEDVNDTKEAVNDVNEEPEASN